MSVQLWTVAYRLKTLYFGILEMCCTRASAGPSHNVSKVLLFMAMEIFSKNNFN